MENSDHSAAASERVLRILKTRGPQTAAGLGGALGVTAEAARQQLVKLVRGGLVEATSTPGGVGRPTRVYGLTPAGQARFPDTHAELTVQLIGTIRRELGGEALDRLVAARGAEMASRYRAALEELPTLGERVARLAHLRSAEGYMAEWRPEGEAFLLIENHCPICAAATACQGFCRTELDSFREVLGEGVGVERVEHALGGDRRCAYRITPAREDSAGKRAGGAHPPARGPAQRQRR